MKWCQEHWDGLRAEIKTQGLETLVPGSPEKAAAALTRQVQGDRSINTFDPLMGAMWAINSFIVYSMRLDPVWVLAIEGCPVCEADKLHQPNCTVNGPGCTDSYSRYFPDAVKDQVKVWEALKND